VAPSGYWRVLKLTSLPGEGVARCLKLPRLQALTYRGADGAVPFVGFG